MANGAEKKENQKKEGGKLKMEGEKSYKMRRRPLTTKICFESTKMGIFYWEKKHFMPGKNQEKWLCPSEKYSFYAPGLSKISEIKGALDNILKFYFWLNFIYHVKCNW